MSQAAGPPRMAELGLAAILGLAPMLLLATDRALPALLIGTAVATLAGWRICRPLGGQTGDVLGAVAILFETGFLLGASAGS